MALTDQDKARSEMIVRNGVDAGIACIRAGVPDPLAVDILADGIIEVVNELSPDTVMQQVVEKLAHGMGVAMMKVAHLELDNG